MNLLQGYILLHLFLRSFSNGIDRLYGTQLSLCLSALAVGMAIVASPYVFRQLPLQRRIFLPLTSLLVLIAISGLSFAINSVATGSIIDASAAWYTIIRYLYLTAVMVLLGCVHRSPDFLSNVHRLFTTMLFVHAVTGIVQWLAGGAVLMTQYDKYERVQGFSSHPVPFSLEVTLLFCVCELTRRKMQLRLGYFHAALYALAVVALILSASRTGLTMLAIIVGLYSLARRPAIFPPLAGLFVMILVASPFEQLFYDLRSLPDYIMNGDFRVWDYRTAVTSAHWRVHHLYYLSDKALEQIWFGFGPGQETFYSPFTLEAHSQFVEIFFEIGITGLTSFAFFWFSIARAGMRDRATLPSAHPSPADVDARVFWVATFAGATLVALFDLSFNQETVAFSYLIVGLFVMLRRSRSAVQGWPAAVGSPGLRTLASAPMHAIHLQSYKPH